MSFTEIVQSSGRTVKTEAGTPSDKIEECECGVLFRKGSWHRHNGDKMTWEDYQENKVNA